METKIIMTTFLGICAVQDIWKRAVMLPILGLFAGAGILVQIVLQEKTVAEIFGGMSIGVALLLLSLASCGQIGKGDGLLVMATGICLGMEKNLMLLLNAVVIAAVFVLILLLMKKVKRKHEIPFIPFLLVSYVVMLCT